MFAESFRVEAEPATWVAFSLEPGYSPRPLRQVSITSYFGPGLVLYLVADLASGRGTLAPLGAAMAVAAVLLSLAPLWVGPGVAVSGASRLAWLGVGAGLSLVRYADHDQMSLAADISRAIGMCLMGGLLMDMAFSLPDRLPWPRQRWTRRWPLWLSLGVGLWLVGSLLPAPPLQWLRDWPFTAYLILPPAGELAAEGVLAGAVLLALGMRLSRRALGSTPEALASNAWGTLALLPAAALGLVVAGATAFGQPWSVAQLAPALAVAAALLVFGHARLINADRRLQAGSATRAVVAVGLTVALLSALATLLMPLLPRSPVAFGCVVAATLFLGMSLHRSLVALTDLLLAPAHGVLLGALSGSAAQLVGVRHLDELVGRVLRALREASGAGDSDPRLYFFASDLEGRIDAAGQPHLGHRQMNEAIVARLRAQPGELIARGPLERQYVRQPTLRGLIEGLVHLDALCVVPLVIEGEVEGALVLPRARRRSALTLEESDALRLFAERVASQAAVLLSEQRAQARAGDMLRQAQAAEAKVEQLADEVRRLRADAVVLRAGRAAHQLHLTPVAYSEAMRRFQARLDAVASTNAPVLLRAEGGTPVAPLAHRVHAESGRSDEAFVIVDCAAVPPDKVDTALFGSEDAEHAPGFLRLASGGTLLLLDLPALPRTTQAALAEAIASRTAKPSGGGAHYPVTARFIASARGDVATLAEADRLDPEMAQRFAPMALAVPPLRERPEDLESLVLFAIDRACRIHGRTPVGLEPEARELLLSYPWPGNQGELQSVIERAVGRCQGKRIGLTDLAHLVRFSKRSGVADVAKSKGKSGAERDPFAGTLEAVERRALRRALERASGNKSEAARSLGLKRTTFLDKLRRHGLDDTGRRAVQ